MFDIRDRLQEAEQETEASYETLAPAVQELQEIAEDAQSWMEEVNDGLDECEALEMRMMRLEAYIEILGQMRRLPAPPDESAFEKTSVRQPPRTKTKRPQRPVPEDVDRAATFQKQREQLKCSPDDPLCGALE